MVPTSTWIAILSALGFGSVVAAALSRWSVISNHRQNWINALRDDLVEHMKQIDAVHYIVSKGAVLSGEKAIIKNTDDQQEAQNAALLVYRRILLRLNLTEEEHIELANGLKALVDDQSDFANPAQVEGVITLAREVLKQEWAVTKYGPFAPVMMTLKSALKDMRSY
jgi:hypothetical protein